MTILISSTADAGPELRLSGSAGLDIDCRCESCIRAVLTLGWEPVRFLCSRIGTSARFPALAHRSEREKLIRP
eukprot:365874-Chlamydomonas_euryale.AAC.12